jgi:hypothetical protein
MTPEAKSGDVPGEERSDAWAVGGAPSMPLDWSRYANNAKAAR